MSKKMTFDECINLSRKYTILAKATKDIDKASAYAVISSTYLNKASKIALENIKAKHSDNVND